LFACVFSNTDTVSWLVGVQVIKEFMKSKTRTKTATKKTTNNKMEKRVLHSTVQEV